MHCCWIGKIYTSTSVHTSETNDTLDLREWKLFFFSPMVKKEIHVWLVTNIIGEREIWKENSSRLKRVPSHVTLVFCYPLRAITTALFVALLTDRPLNQQNPGAPVPYGQIFFFLAVTISPNSTLTLTLIKRLLCWVARLCIYVLSSTPPGSPLRCRVAVSGRTV